jgi:hypothetical protein
MKKTVTFEDGRVGRFTALFKVTKWYLFGIKIYEVREQVS